MIAREWDIYTEKSTCLYDNKFIVYCDCLSKEEIEDVDGVYSAIYSTSAGYFLVTIDKRWDMDKIIEYILSLKKEEIEERKKGSLYIA